MKSGCSALITVLLLVGIQWIMVHWTYYWFVRLLGAGMEWDGFPWPYLPASATLAIIVLTNVVLYLVNWLTSPRVDEEELPTIYNDPNLHQEKPS